MCICVAHQTPDWQRQKVSAMYLPFLALTWRSQRSIIGCEAFIFCQQHAVDIGQAWTTHVNPSRPAVCLESWSVRRCFAEWRPDACICLHALNVLATFSLTSPVFTFRNRFRLINTQNRVYVAKEMMYESGTFPAFLGVPEILDEKSLSKWAN